MNGRWIVKREGVTDVLWWEFGQGEMREVLDALDPDDPLNDQFSPAYDALVDIVRAHDVPAADTDTQDRWTHDGRSWVFDEPGFGQVVAVCMGRRGGRIVSAPVAQAALDAALLDVPAADTDTQDEP